VVGARIRGMVLALLAPLFLMGCAVVPGRFTATLDIAADRSFAFAYQGEIVALDLGDEFARGMKDAGEDSDSEATALHIAARQAAEAPDDATRDERLRALADLLGKEAGYRQVEYKGDGIFDVDFSVSGRMTHDFAFPMVEKMPMANMFVTMMLRDGNQVRVDAPGFASQGGGNPMAGMMTGMMGLASLGKANEEGEDGEMPNILLPNGTFTIVTDGRILANNTDEGPVSTARGETLVWEIDQRTEQAPTALISFD